MSSRLALLFHMAMWPITGFADQASYPDRLYCKVSSDEEHAIDGLYLCHDNLAYMKHAIRDGGRLITFENGGLKSGSRDASVEIEVCILRANLSFLCGLKTSDTGE